jgi:hypothetical protein
MRREPGANILFAATTSSAIYLAKLAWLQGAMQACCWPAPWA